MFRDITLGQFYQTDSILHRLDPRVKLLGTILFFVSLFCINNPVGYVMAIAFLAIVIIISNVPFKYMIKGMQSIMFILLITVVVNLFAVRGETLVSIGRLVISKEGVIQAVYLALRLCMLIIGSSIMTLTTTPNNLTDGMEKGLGFLKVIKVPVHEVAMMMSIALRFIPILMEETDKIMKAQLARGADFESGNLIKKVKAYVPILVPLFVSAFRRANDLAMAMEARCYRGGDSRTKMKPLKYAGRDTVAYIVLVIYTAGTIVVGRLPIFDINVFIEIFKSMRN